MSTSQSLAPGKELGRYELLLPVAQGGMATVWAARQKGSRGFQKTVAIKTMLPALSDDAMFERMFLDEAALAARIHHPNVAEILDLGEQDDILYIVMEWIDGEALSVLARASKKSDILIPPRICLRIAAQACMGLHAAHELADENDQPLGIVHRDVSPQNILVTYDGRVKLVDFGVAKATNRAGGETSAGQLKGKIPYMSPEQAKGGNVDRRTDIFAMGIVLYKLTTGIHPFAGDTDLATMTKIISQPVLPPRARNPRYPANLEQVLLKCLQKDPDKRYSTMLEMERAVQEVLIGEGATTDEDVATFVRTLMGDRGQKRRAQLRDAVRLLDERATTPTLSEGPLVHENVSELVLTQMRSGVGRDFPPPRPSGSGLEMLADSAVLTSPTHLPVEVPNAKRRRSGVVVVAAAAIALTGLLGAGFVLSTKNTATAPAAPPAAPTLDPAPPALAQTAAAPTTSASVEPAALDVSALPSPTPDAPADARSARPDPRSAPPTSTKPSATPSSTTATKPSTKWVPSVTNPGF
ncbi:serine/threonine protein kinase [Chondromyces apiculatus]|uniref:Serine/threonine-protein kinase n=1 Tax=Chondromyces apiculatus DSM 436 TaxID=1192034 RepID=A0A017TF76_9BACT|nr:serine/threonine protein kinase [Chondromyces apiculatus]EYF07899.1 Serine/threonine-protein kinase [Chondromyces apiculatus DSM 436]